MSLKIPKNYLSMHRDCSELLCVRAEYGMITVKG